MEQMVFLDQTEQFRTALLGRLRSDCEYFLGAGGRNPHCLWALDVSEQIDTMKALYNSFADDEKPDWISMSDIETYEQKMLKDEGIRTQFYDDQIAKGFHVIVDGAIVTSVEVMNDGEIRTILYNEGKDEPIDIVSYNR